jgi:hypothetical protein
LWLKAGAQNPAKKKQTNKQGRVDSWLRSGVQKPSSSKANKSVSDVITIGMFSFLKF